MEGKYCCGYSEDVDVIRDREYPLLKSTLSQALAGVPAADPNIIY